jgi:hypothetical protein
MAHGVAGGRIPGRLAEAHSSPAARSIGGLAVERPGKTQKAGDQHEGDLRKNQLSTLTNLVPHGLRAFFWWRAFCWSKPDYPIFTSADAQCHPEPGVLFWEDDLKTAPFGLAHFVKHNWEPSMPQW